MLAAFDTCWEIEFCGGLGGGLLAGVGLGVGLLVGFGLAGAGLLADAGLLAGVKLLLPPPFKPPTDTFAQIGK